MEWMMSISSAVCCYMLVLPKENGWAVVRKPAPLPFPGCSRGSLDKERMCTPKSSCLVQGEEDFVMRGQAGKKTNKQDLISRGREQTSRQSLEPEKKEAFPAQRGLSRVCHFVVWLGKLLG